MGSWAPTNGGGGGEEDQGAEQTVSISRFLNENKEMGIDVTELEGAAVRESVEKMAAAAGANIHSNENRPEPEGQGSPGKSAMGGGNGWGSGSHYEMGPTGTVKKLVLDEDRRVIGGGPRPMPERPKSTVEGIGGGGRPLPMPLDVKSARMRSGSIESLGVGGTMSRVAAIRSKYDSQVG